MRPRRSIQSILIALLALCPLWTSPLAAAGGDWLQFRGPGSSSASPDGNPPAALDAESLAWKAELPGRGVSSPIAVRGRVVLTASSGARQDRLHVLCFDASSGKKLWERQFWSTGRTMCHPKTCMAAPTPASDGERIFAFYSTNDLFCLDLEGNLLWLRGLTQDYPNASNSVGMASSLLCAGNVVVAQVENSTFSFAAGLDARTGENRWRIERPRKPSWASPVLLRGAAPGEDAVLLESWTRLSAHDPATGREIWAHTADCNCIPSCAVGGDVIYLPSKGLTALRPKKDGAAPEILWQSSRLGPGMSSPIALEGRIYSINSAGVLNCADGASGQVLWQLRLQGPISSTAVAAGGRLYAFSEEGLAQVVRLPRPGGSDEKGVIEGSWPLQATILATPAISGNALFIRSDGHLWKFARKEERK